MTIKSRDIPIIKANSYKQSDLLRDSYSVLTFVTLLFLFLVLYFVQATPIFAADNTASSSPSLDYRIGPEDVLDISVWKEPDLHKEVLVRPDGGVTFPLAGDIMAAKKTPQQLQDEITKKIKKYIPDAVVTVSVVKLTGFRIYVNGKVNKPGQYTIGRYLDVLQALTLAGGLTPYASSKEIKILRRENGKEVTYHFNYKEVKNGENLGQNIQLKNDDVVVVP